MNNIMESMMEIVKYLKLYINARYMENQMVNLNEAGRYRICSLLGCSIIELDIAITKLRISKEIKVERQLVVSVRL